MLLGLVSAQGAPGVTTTALALAAVAGPTSGLFVELDPAGGSVEGWTGVTGEPGLLRVAGHLRRGQTSDQLVDHVVGVPSGVRSLLAPTAGPVAESTLVAVDERLGPALAGLDVDVVVADAGRWSRSQVTARRIMGCAVLGVVCAPTVHGIEHARWLIDPLRATFDVPVVVVVVGERGYGPDEVADALGVPVAGVVAWDRRGVNALFTSGASRGWSRCPLARTARTTLAGLRRHVDIVGMVRDA
ncbi:MAG: hypothetical protein AMXMBFR46_28910 [Acidimicrobiia bacterium]